MQLHAAVAKQPVAVASGTRYSNLRHYSGGILDGYCPTSPDHAVIVVGYHGGCRDPAHWIIKNSWGGHWGMMVTFAYLVIMSMEMEGALQCQC